jgi:hypothetical protein
MATSRLQKIIGQILFAIIIGVIAYFIFLRLRPKSENQKILEGAYKSFNEWKKDDYLKDAALNSAMLVYLIDSTSKEAKDCKNWVLQQGLSIDSLIKADSIKTANAPKLNKEQMDSLGKAANNYLLYHGTPGNSDEAFDKIHIAFEGMPETGKVRPLLEAVMNRYKIVINNDNVLKVANVLVALKNDSKVGVTEMEILKHIYQTGSTSIDYSTQAAISAGLLEQYK